jgi:hypothetical protein
MRTNQISKAIAVAISIGVGAAAMAQTNGPTGFSARLGIFFPTNSDSRDVASTWLGFGADYKIATQSVSSVTPGNPAYLSISGDWYGSHDVSSVPLALNYNVRSDQLVWSVGLGPEFRHLGGDNAVGISGQVGVAYDLANNTTTPVFIQGKYFLSSKSELSGFGLYVGVRF